MKKIFLLFAATVACVVANAQTVARTGNNLLDANKMSAADKSGNANDALTNFYQLSLRNIFGKNGEISVSTTVFGLLDSLNNKIEVDTLYSKYRWARNIQINASGKIDSANNISSLGGGVTVSIVNRRDLTRKTSAFSELEPIEMAISEVKKKALRSATGNAGVRAAFAGQNDVDSAIIASISASISRFRTSHNPADLDTNFVNELKKAGDLKKYMTLVRQDDSMFRAIQKNIERRGLWTAGATYRRHPQTGNDTLGFQTDYIVGLGRNTERKLWEFAAAAFVKSFKDTALSQASAAHAEVGLNKVLLEDKDRNSRMELKFFASYDQVLTGNNDPVFAGNLTWRISVFKDLWLPVAVKYDDNGKLWGFLSVTYNLDKYKPNN